MNRFSKVGFILAALGSSIGLGHIWRFPYMAGENGGGAFVLFYLFLALSIGVSMLLAEMLIGNKARSNPMDCYAILDKLNKLPPQTPQKEHNVIDNTYNKSFIWLGLNTIASPLILSFYAVVLGWILYYLINVSFALPSDISQAKEQFTFIHKHSLVYQICCFSSIIILTALIVAKGIKKGIEKLNFILMPLLLFIFTALLLYAFTLDEFSQAWDFMFAFNPQKITLKTLIDSMGQVFFSLSLGVGAISVYAANAQQNENLLKSSLWVVLSGIVISLIAGLMIFTFIYHFKGQPSEGVGLLLISLPLAFNTLGSMGSIISVLFFTAVLFAGITSTISMLEPAVSVFRDKFAMSQVKATCIVSVGILSIGLLVILWANENSHLPSLFGKDLFGFLDFITSSILMPIGMLVALIFLGFYIKRSHLRHWTPYLNDTLFTLWRVMLRYITPLVIIIILLSQSY
ncbi:sodium-dependent transporter [Helicobacter sp. MIT 05-5293]|uniref:sodium-dependent transporter n=1 Tax=Helicobacter sp. MIT 05-5293 TaxID=1548149 RepID=UPI00051DE190|nr:sodium-dependent transporter [Helicobacter sp. MIT 05-5293]TLD81559.1 sodium-dependent transporter [Helicobacter sp. MIT 05-5293]